MKGIIDYEIAKKLGKKEFYVPVFYASGDRLLALADDTIMNNYLKVAKDIVSNTKKYLIEQGISANDIKVEEINEFQSNSPEDIPVNVILAYKIKKMYILTIILICLITIYIITKPSQVIQYFLHFFIGFVIMSLLFNIEYFTNTFRPHNQGLVLIYLAYIFSYFLLFFSSLSYLLFNQKSMKIMYFLISGIVYILIITFVGFMLDTSSYKGIFHIGIRLFISFFPLHFYSYYLKYLKK